MLKRRLPRFIALLGTVGVLASLISVAVASTGAYYTQSVAGAVSGNNGTVAITVSGNTIPGNLAFDFSGILPGVAKTATIGVTNTGGNPEAIWLVFDNSNSMWSAVNNLGQYGKFTVGGLVYDNLSNKYASTTGVAGTPISGSYMSTNPTNSCYNVPRIPVNYLPHAINLGTLTAGASFSFPISFTYIACMTNHQGEAIFNAAENNIGNGPITPGPLVFKIAAFQDGVDPTSLYNGADAIVPLNLAGYGAYINQ